MSSEEDDYMSDKFLTKCIPDVRPGLIKDRAKQREVEVEAKRIKLDEERRSQRKPGQKERLEEGLSSALTSENKGFAMLAKMGYKQGQSLGKSSSGIVEPIGIKIKSDRGGLGREAALKDLNAKRHEIRRKRLLEKSGGVEISTEDFRRRMQEKNQGRLLESALRKCQRTCEELDKSNQIESPPLPWFWPEQKDDQNEKEGADSGESDSEEEEIEYETYEKVDMLTCYLRHAYTYCHWCGVHYFDSDDMEKNCPGPFKDDH